MFERGRRIAERAADPHIVAIARGRQVECGCFGTAKVQKTDAQRLTDMKWAIARDVGLLLLVAQILAASLADVRRP